MRNKASNSHLKIAILCRGDPFNTAAGTEIYVKNLSIELARRGHIVHIICGGRSSYTKQKNLLVHCFHPINIPYIRAIDFRRKLLHLCMKVLNRYNIDVMIAAGAGTFPSYIFKNMKAKLDRRPLLIYYAIDSMKMEYESSKLSLESKKPTRKFKMWIWYFNLIKSDRDSCYNSDLILASSKDTAIHLIADYGVKEERAKILYLGVPDDFTQGIEAIDPEMPTFIHIAGGVRKGTIYFLQAMKLLKERYGLEAKAVIARATSYEISLANRLKINAEIYSCVPQLNLRRLYASSTALVAPSLSEGFCLPVIEAAMFGKPAIVSNTGALPELVINGENGFIIPVADVGALARRMYQIAVNEQLRKYMGEKAKEFSQRFKISNVTKTLIEILSSTCMTN